MNSNPAKMESLGIFLCVLSAYFFSGTAGLSGTQEQITSLRSGSNSKGIFEADSNFKCPLPIGVYSDPEDCSYYYVCVGNRAVHKKCRTFQKFDILRRTCLPSFIAVCGNDNSKTTTATSTATKETTPSDDSFTCPGFMGTHPHPRDCSKYYTCILYKATLKTCSEGQLFDAVKSTCKPENDVNCGTRQRPGSTTPEVITEPITETTTSEVITETIPETTTSEVITETIPETTTSEDITDTITETITTTLEPDSPTTTVISTTDDFPTGPPETDCDEDDVDCIIDETGDVVKWFRCPEDIGSHVHPSSNKLFIFCMNWIPSVKKCGMNMVYSEEHGTCIEVKYIW